MPNTESDPLTEWIDVIDAVMEDTMIGKLPVDRLFSTQVGERVTIDLPLPVDGEVIMNHLHGNGTGAISIALVDYLDTFAFLQREPDGNISGHILSRSHPWALLVEAGDSADTLRVTATPLHNVICAGGKGSDSFLGLPRSPPEDSGNSPEVAETTSGSIPLLESRPGAKKVIYLDFDGETVVGSSWNSYNGGDPIVARPYGSPSNIPKIWKSVSEDYRVFDVNVTTDRNVFQAASSTSRCMVIFSPSSEWYGSAGGVAYLRSYGSSANYMCWVFNASMNGAAEAASHEAGHQFGLHHDGTSTSSYYTGHTNPSGISWGPIMGASYNRSIVQFSKGDYTDANEDENDLDIISGTLPYRTDIHSDTALVASSATLLDPGKFEEIGNIRSDNDSDVFKIRVGGPGTIRLQATVDPDYPNLDVQLELTNLLGIVLSESRPNGSFNASLSYSVQSSGTYYIRIRGSELGTASNGYPRYGSIGNYTLTGTFPPVVIPPPPVNLSASDGTFTEHVALTWSDVSSATSYRVFRATSDSTLLSTQVAATASPSYRDTEAEIGETYFYWVTALNDEGESSRSSVDSGYRSAPLPSSPSSFSASDGIYTSFTALSWSSSPYAAGYYVFRNTSNSTSGALELAFVDSGTSYLDRSGNAAAIYYYFVRAVNSAGMSSSSPINSGRRAAALLTPSNLAATQGLIEGRVYLTWNSTLGANGYSVARGISSDARDAEFLATTATTSFTDASAQSGIYYYYFVRAEGLTGDSAFTDGVVGYAGAPTPGDDSYEGNDRILDAYPLTNYSNRWLSTIFGYAVAADDDWYEVIPSDGSNRIDAILTRSGPSGNVEMLLYTQSGSLLAAATPLGDDLILSHTGVSPNVPYYFLIRPLEPASDSYNLVWKSLRPGDPSNRVDLTIGSLPMRQHGRYTFLTSQSQGDRTRGRRPRSSFNRVVNEGTEAAAVRYSGSSSTALYSIRYRMLADGSWENVTAAVQSGSYSELMEPLEEQLAEIQVQLTRRGIKRVKWCRIHTFGQITGASITDDKTSYLIRNKTKDRRKSRKRRSRR